MTTLRQYQILRRRHILADLPELLRLRIILQHRAAARHDRRQRSLAQTKAARALRYYRLHQRLFPGQPIRDDCTQLWPDCMFQLVHRALQK